MFSVAIHTYNRPDYLVEAIESVLGQTLQPNEIVVVIDGPPESMQKLIEEALQPFSDRTRVLTIANAGAGGSRAVSIENCQNEWIACLDDDDVWLPNHLEEVAKTIDAFPSANFIFTNLHFFGTSITQAHDHFSKTDAAFWNLATEDASGDMRLLSTGVFEAMLDFNPVFPSASAIQRSFYDRIGGYDLKHSRRSGEDSEMTRRFALLGRLACNSKSTVRIRKHNCNMSMDHFRNLYGKAVILTDLSAKGIVPDYLIDRVNDVAEECRTDSFRAACYARRWREAKQISRNIRLSRLGFRDLMKLSFAHIVTVGRELGGDPSIT